MDESQEYLFKSEISTNTEAISAKIHAVDFTDESSSCKVLYYKGNFYTSSFSLIFKHGGN